MDPIKSFKARVANLENSQFEQLALDLFRYQAVSNPVYSRFITELGIVPSSISTISEIPFLPIQFFKTQKVKSGSWKDQRYFHSSGTTSTNRSTHLIEDEHFYLENCRSGFEGLFGPLAKLKILSLLPNYEEQPHSSLIYMMDYLMRISDSDSGYIPPTFDFASINLLDRKTILFGVSFALLDLAEKGIDLGDVIVVETGGMKGRGPELTKEEFYSKLRKGLNVENVYSEYGMTELLSQAYGENGIFKCASTMEIVIRDTNDPREILGTGKTGGINLIDLANVHSCAFIETQDLGQLMEDGRFKVLGRFDNSDLRGCSLMSL